MLYALFALILIPVGLNALGFRPLYDHRWHLDGAPLSLFSVVLCVMMALHLPMNCCASIPIEGCGSVCLNTPLTRVERPGLPARVRIGMQYSWA